MTVFDSPGGTCFVRLLSMKETQAGDRSLVSVRTVDRVESIEGADGIEVARVGGWNIVVKRGEFAPGDPCVYFELDALLPTDDARFAFLAERGERTTRDGRTGHVLKTARLRGVFSQGLVMPLDLFPEIRDAGSDDLDLGALIGVSKWEPPIPAGLEGEVLGPFPSAFARKTDSERIQNLTDVFDQIRSSAEWVATEKIDGMSVTFILDDGKIRVCGRNWEYAEWNNNTMWALARSLNLAEQMVERWALQGEVFGEGIGSNPLKISGTRLAVFALSLDRIPLPREEWPEWVRDIAAPELELELPGTVEGALLQADELESMITPGQRAEGVVWHTRDGSVLDELDGRGTFKVISNRYLLKHDR